MTLNSTENTSQEQNIQESIDQSIKEKITRFLERKFIRSRSFKTKTTYKIAINNFLKFLHGKYSLDLNQLLEEVKTNQKDPIDVMDDYNLFLANRPNKKGKTGLCRSTSSNYLSVVKQFLNGEGCKIYEEDLRSRFKLPPSYPAYEEGLTRHVINRVIRLSNPKLAAVILMACSGGYRIMEIVQLRLSDIDFTTNPTKILVRADTEKKRRTRVTHISSEATTALKDYIAKYIEVNDETGGDKYIFLIHHEERIRDIKNRIEQRKLKKKPTVHLEKLRDRYESELKVLGSEERFDKDANVARQNLQNQLARVRDKIPELNVQTENQRNLIHFHAFRAWFKTQVTDAHQSDFAEALIGHSSVKLLYYRQNAKAREETYKQIEHAVTIADTEKFDQNITETQKNYQDLQSKFDGISKLIRDLEKNAVLKTKS